MNAKDLALAKIGAVPSMLGLYDYGISIGIGVKELESLINSKTGQIIAKYAESNILNNDIGCSRALQAIKKLEGNIGANLMQFNTFGYHPAFPKVNGTGETVDRQTDILHELIINTYSSVFKTSRGSIALKIHKLATAGLLTKTLESTSTESSLQALKLRAEECYSQAVIEKLTGNQLYATKNFYASLIQLIEWCKQYEKDILTILNDKNSEVIPGQATLKIEDLRTLAEGAAEMTTLGRFLSSNKGTKTKEEDAINFVRTFENCILDREENMLEAPDGAEKISMVRFFYDLDYQQQCINKYDEFKHSINILAAIANVPHFTGYMEINAVPYASIQTISSRFRAKLKYADPDHLEKVLKVKDTTSKERAAKMIDMLINQKFLRGALTLAGLTFIMPEKTIITTTNNETIEQPFIQFTSRFTQIKSAGGPISLGSEAGLATFKYFMETYIIPKMLELPEFSNNKFVKSLIPVEVDNSLAKNAVTMYTLEGNMIPSSEAEDALLEEYISDFDLLRSYDFYKTLGIEINQIDAQTNALLTFADAFYIYAQYCYNGKKGPRSLMALFDNTIPYTKELLNKYIAEMDLSGDLILTDEEIIKACAPNTTEYSDNEIAYVTGRQWLGRKLKRRNPNYGKWIQGELDEDSYLDRTKWLDYSEQRSLFEQTKINEVKKEIEQGSTVSKLNTETETRQFFLYPQVSKELPDYKLTLVLDSLNDVSLMIDAKDGSIKNLNEITKPITKFIEKNASKPETIDEIEYQNILETKVLDIVKTLKDNPKMLVTPTLNKSGKIALSININKILDLLNTTINTLFC